MSDDGRFDEAVASHYDDPSDPMFSDEVLGPTAALLAELAAGGQALELGIGTGRVALPLAARGVPVSGIELSRAMLARLSAKPGGDAVPVAVGDFSSRRLPGGEGAFALVYLVFNTIMNVTSQAGQVAVFRNAAAHLRPGGAFLIETMVPDLRLLPPGQRFVPFDVSEGHLGFDEYDVVEQGLISHHYTRGEDGRFAASQGPFRYVWPSELDLMAQLAGLELRDRWAGWGREPFTAESRSHVSVWSKPPAP